MDALRAMNNYEELVSAASTLVSAFENEAETAATLLCHFMQLMAEEYKDATMTRKAFLKRQLKKCAEVYFLLLCEDETKEKAGRLVIKLLTD